MRLPIQYALSYLTVCRFNSQPLDLAAIGTAFCPSRFYSLSLLGLAYGEENKERCRR
ncbi:MAG: hypothetical protein ACLSA6_07900 [Holdemania massiliensis]